MPSATASARWADLTDDTPEAVFAVKSLRYVQHAHFPGFSLGLEQFLRELHTSVLSLDSRPNSHAALCFLLWMSSCTIMQAGFLVIDNCPLERLKPEVFCRLCAGHVSMSPLLDCCGRTLP